MWDVCRVVFRFVMCGWMVLRFHTRKIRVNKGTKASPSASLDHTIQTKPKTSCPHSQNPNSSNTHRTPPFKSTIPAQSATEWQACCKAHPRHPKHSGLRDKKQCTKKAWKAVGCLVGPGIELPLLEDVLEIEMEIASNKHYSIYNLLPFSKQDHVAIFA